MQVTTSLESAPSSRRPLSEKKWLHDASMRRLSQRMKDHKEVLLSAKLLKLSLNNNDSEQKEKQKALKGSGLSKAMVKELEDWVVGMQTGRQCMLTLLDLHQKETAAVDNSLDDLADLDLATHSLDLLRTAHTLPTHFLCDSGRLFERIFAHSPLTIVRETLQRVLAHSLTQSASALTLPQIQIALQQIHLDMLCEQSDERAKERERERERANEEDSVEDLGESHKALSSSYDTRLEARILAELVRIHIQRETSSSESRSSEDKEKDSESRPQNENSHKSQTISEFVGLTLAHSVKEIHTHALSLTPETLAESNILLKDYLVELAKLRANLTKCVATLRDAKAFLALGLSSSNSSEEEAKRAYRKLAVRLHPDKRGGDTAQFQALQGCYQEVLRRLREKERDSNVGSKKSRHKAPRVAESTGLRGRGEGQREDTHVTASATSQHTDHSVSADPEQASTHTEKSSVVREDIHADAEADPPSKTKPLRADSDSDSDSEPAPCSTPIHTDTRTPRTTDDDANHAPSPSLSQSTSAPSYHNETHWQRAQRLLAEFHTLLPHIQQCAKESAVIAQQSLHWHKEVDKRCRSLRKAEKKSNNAVVDALSALIKTLTLPEGPSSEFSLSALSPTVESLCERAQRVCSVAMEIASQCGPYFTQAAALSHGLPSQEGSVLSLTERAMSTSLSTLRCVVSVSVSAEALRSACERVRDVWRERKRVSDSQTLSKGVGFLSERERERVREWCELVCEMVSQSVGSASAAVCSCSESATRSAVAVTELCACVEALCERADDERDRDIREQEQERESERERDELSQEDRESLDRAQQRNQGRGPRPEEHEGEDEANESETQSDKDESSPQEALSTLRDKVSQLHAQLAAQNAHTLHTLTAETLSLQRELHAEMATVTSFVVDPAHTTALLERVFSLLADCVESSLCMLRFRFASDASFINAFPSETSSVGLKDWFANEIANEREPSAHLASSRKESLRGLVERELSWLSVRVSSSSDTSVLSIVMCNVDSLLSPPSADQQRPTPKSLPQLALWPDTRSRILSLAAQLDSSLVHEVVSELTQKLIEIVNSALCE